MDTAAPGEQELLDGQLRSREGDDGGEQGSEEGFRFTPVDDNWSDDAERIVMVDSSSLAEEERLH